jgi:hypothetical protein
MTEVCNKRVVVVRDCNDEWDVVLNRMVECGEVYTAVRYRCQGIQPLVITEYFLLEVRRWVPEESVMDLCEWREMRIDKIIL